MGLIIKTPPTYPKERAYIIDVLFGVFWGLDYQIEIQDHTNTVITLDGSSGVVLPDILFQYPADRWLTTQSLPKQPLPVWDVGDLGLSYGAPSSTVPAIYGSAKALSGSISRGTVPGYLELPIDILGAAFFMLTRYEEVVKTERDRHGRFPVNASLAYQEGFLERPIINEYLEILWACMIRLWPGLTRKQRSYRLLLSHDVDTPLIHPKTTGRQCLKACVGDIIKRRSCRLAGQRVVSRWEVAQGKYERDPFNTFSYIMDISERRGIKSAFYFTCGADAAVIQKRYDVHSPWIRNLMSAMHARGHEIGLHPSIGTYRDEAKTRAEFGALRNACAEIGISQAEWGGRQHRLQWENPTTWHIWDSVHLNYDSTLTFAERPGFRCGVCYEYPVFNVLTRARMGLRERPLIVMEGSLFSYMGCDLGAASGIIESLSRKCRFYQGDFTFLCHNSQLITHQQQLWYEQVVDIII